MKEVNTINIDEIYASLMNELLQIKRLLQSFVGCVFRIFEVYCLRNGTKMLDK